MARQSLYRTYRPQTFDDVVGQAHITRTLRNSVAEGNVAHAYLFAGPRGTGKTTTARILAKALDCEKGPTPDPDATCEQCIAIAEGRHPDVFELDAASRTGVDNVREEIIGRVQFAPTQGRCKVYIIDEVHMLSTAAFNALLKTLEEPPSHVVFVLATTHPHKVPETIQSRCQRFDFHRIGIDDIADRLRYIAEAEGIKADKHAFPLIARHAAGGMRDAITTLEQLAAFTGDDIAIDDVEGLLGEVDSTLLFELADIVARRDIAGSFRYVASFSETGADMAEFVRAFTGHIRDLFVTGAVDDPAGIVDRSAEEVARLRAQAAEFGSDRLARILAVLGDLAAEMRWSSDPRLSLEVALTRLARPQGEMTLESLAERVEALEGGTTAGIPSRPPCNEPAARPSPPAPRPATAEAKSEPAESTPASAASVEVEAVPVVKPGEPLDRAHAKRAWPAVLAELKKRSKARAQAFAACEIDVDDDGATLVIEFPADASFALSMAEDAATREHVRRSLAAVLGYAPAFRYQLGRGGVRPEIPPAPAPESPVDVPPTPEEASPPVRDQDAPPSDDLEDLLVNGLGARIVAERPAPEANDLESEDR